MAWPRLEFIDYVSDIDAPVEEVFRFFKDVEKWPSWTKAIKKAYRKSEGDWRVGFKLGFASDLLPMPLEVKVIEFEEGRRIAWGMRNPVATIIHRFDFEPSGDRRCRVRHTEYAEGLFAILTWPLRGKIEQFDRLIADDLKATFAKA